MEARVNLANKEGVRTAADAGLLPRPDDRPGNIRSFGILKVRNPFEEEPR